MTDKIATDTVVSVRMALSKQVLQMNKANEQMQAVVSEFEEKRKRFFRFDGWKNIFFWGSQAISIITLVLLIFFLFEK